MNRVRLFLVCLPLLLLGIVPTADACLFCSEQRGPTLADDFSKAAIVLVGSCVNPKLGDLGIENSTTDFIIEDVVKSHEAIKGMKKVVLPRYVADIKNKHVIFVDVYKGKLDFYRGLPVPPGSDIVKYLTGSFAVDKKSAPERLRFFFDYLNHPEYDVALDAYREFAKSDYSDYRTMASSLPASKIAGWINDPKTPAYRLGLFASLLGHCGGADEAKLLKSIIDDPEKRKGSGIDGMMAGYVMLDPEKGWAYLSGRMTDPKEDFQYRYSAFRTARFLWESRPDLVEKKTLIKSMGSLVNTPDMSDFAIDELRKWKQWEMTEPILSLWGKKGYELNVIKRAIVRFALRSDQPAAKTFIAEQRRRDAEWVNGIEELLKLE